MTAMSIHVTIPSFPDRCSCIRTNLAGMTISSPLSASGTSSSCLILLPSPAQLRWPSFRSSPRRTCNADLDVAVKASSQQQSVGELRTCRNCKKPFNSSQNHPRACRFHTAHFGGETKRKFESVHSGGTMDTVGGGEITQYWHCCGSNDPFDPGCEAAPHSTYDD